MLAVGVATAIACAIVHRARGKEGEPTNNEDASVPNYKVHLAARVRGIKPIPIKVIAARVTEQTRAGRKIVNMSQGVPCLPLFEPSIRDMKKLLETGKLPYSNVSGSEDVRTVAAKFVNQFYKLPEEFTSKNVVVTAGGIQACHLALGMVLEDSTDVLLTSVPAYPLYGLECAYFGGHFAPIEAENGHAVPSSHAIEAAFKQHRMEGRNVRAIILCAPNNPTGAVLTECEAKLIVSVLEHEMEMEASSCKGKKGFLLILDEVYLGIEQSEHVSLLQYASHELRKRTCLVLSASKGIGAMPGARAAWLTCGDTDLIAQLVKIESCATGNASTISQRGLKSTLEHCMSSPKALTDVQKYYAERTDYFVSGLNAVAEKNGFKHPFCTRPKGTFYVWANFSECTAKTDDEIFEAFLEQGLAVIPGSAFEMEATKKFIRFSCAVPDMEALDEALQIVSKSLSRWRKSA